jgi:GNAT superfamily N-acetyltransferase
LADADGTGGPSDSADPGGIVHLSAAPVTFESTTVSDPRFVALADAAVADIAVRYESDEPMIPLRADHMVEVILACVAGQPVGCASLAVPPDTVADPSAAPGTEGGPASSEVPDQMTLGEVKRLYVAPEARRRGVARTLMRELETRAVQRGLAAMVLETGTAQPEALALYESLGFHLIAYYGHYAEDPRSRCYAKHLR